MITLDTEISMKVPPAQSEPEQRPPAAMRYTYASGSQPLPGYTIKRGVGRGGFGEVYFGVSDAGKEVALKLIRRNLDVELRGVTQCLNLKHHNLVALYDIRTDEYEDRWVVMEYVSGESLEDVIDRHPKGMPIDLLLHWFEGIAAGVAYLHDHGIVHRDLKPANIFIDESIVKIGDYGLSKFISCSRRSGQTESVGTVHYMAPEIANGRYGKEIDTYALGIILYEMLTGHVPFEGESVGEVLMKHLTAEPDLDVLDEPYREIVRGAMAKDPDTRIKSVAQMLERLPATERRVPVIATPVSAEANGTSQPSVAAAAGASAPWPGDGATNPPPAADEEPILASLRDGWRHAERSFRESQWHPLIKATIAVLAVIALVATSPEWLTLTIVLGFAYLVYRAVRAIIMQPRRVANSPPGGSVPPPAAPLAGTPAIPPALSEPSSSSPPRKRLGRRARRYSWRQQLEAHVAARPWRERMTELVGSMIVAAVVAGLLSLLGCALVSNTFSTPLCLWMTLVATLGSWAVMIPTKFVEGRFEDQAPLRFVLLIAGALVGSVACGMASFLELELPVSRAVAPGPSDSLAGEFLQIRSNEAILNGFSSGSVPLTLPVAITFFAFLYVLLRWWGQAEYARPTRVSLWSILACTLAAFLITFVWWFPQPMGAVLAGMIALVTQLSSPWMPPSQRRRLTEAGV